MSADVLIVGGGLSGSALAIDLARRGLSVTLVDRAEFPRDKPCGEGLLADGVAQLDALGAIDLLQEAHPLRGIVYLDSGLRAVGEFAADATGYGVRRLTLDAAIHARAIACGANAVRGEVTAVATSDRSVAVTLRDGRTFSARALVGADGPRSLVRRALGLDRPVSGDGRYALRQHFRVTGALPSHVHVSFHGDYELYVTPVGQGILGVTALCARRVTQAGGGTKAERLAQLLAAAPVEIRALLSDATPVSEALACGPLRVRASAVCRERALLVGDAAGYVDAITGEGMSLGLRGAGLAADALDRWLVRGERRELAFLRYAEQRARLVRTHVLITSALVAIAAKPLLRHKLVRAFAAHPDSFARWLSVSHDERPLRSLPARDFWRLAAA